MASWKFFIETHGCKVNQSESQMLREAWARLGGIETDRPELADYILVNSCAITSNAERDARNAVYRHKRNAAQAKIILTGCAAQLFSDFRPRKKAIWAKPDYCVIQKNKGCLADGPEVLAKGTEDRKFFRSLAAFQRARPIIKIQDGCSQHCSYCIVPQTRGKPVSRSAIDIVRECRNFAEAGYAELIISGVNLNQYYRPETGDFWALLACIDDSLHDAFSGRTRLRISSLWPAQLTDRSLEILASLKMICPHIHLSLQHASPKILQDMGRGSYNPDNLLDILGKLRQIWPVMGLGADIIVGYPGETEKEMQILLEFVAEAGFTHAHVFPFSARPGTRAASLPAQLPYREKAKRASWVRELLARQQQEFLEKQLKLSVVKVVLDHFADNAPKGINEFYTVCQFQSGMEGNGRGLIECRPHKICKNKLLVEKI